MPDRPLLLCAATLVALAIALPGCRLKPRADLPQLADEGRQPIEQTGLRSVFIAIHTGPLPKPSREAVTIRLRWRDQVIITETIGLGHRWEPGTTRAVEFPISPPVRMDAPGVLVLEIAKPSVENISWPVQVEALGRLTDGGILALLDRTPPVSIGAGAPDQSSWTLLSR
jgi:hypothetical protein